MWLFTIRNFNYGPDSGFVRPNKTKPHKTTFGGFIMLVECYQALIREQKPRTDANSMNLSLPGFSYFNKSQ